MSSSHILNLYIYSDELIDGWIDEGTGALGRVQAEPAAVWEAAFYLKEGDAITTWAFWLQNTSWRAAGSESSLSSHLMPARWHSGWESGTGGSGLAWAG